MIMARKGLVPAPAADGSKANLRRTAEALGVMLPQSLLPRADDVWMIQTNPNNVFQGTVTKVSH